MIVVCFIFVKSLVDHANPDVAPLKPSQSEEQVEPDLLHEIAAKDQVVHIRFQFLEMVDLTQEVPVGRELRKLHAVQTVLSFCCKCPSLSVPLKYLGLAGLLTVSCHF